MTAPARLDLAETYRACREGVVAGEATCDVVRVTGPDALSYLQTQCSQDLGELAPGGVVTSLLLTPQGHVEALVHVACIASDAAAVVVAAGFGDVVHARLRRFRLRVKADLEQVTWRLVRVRGPLAATPSELAESSGALVAAPVAWPGNVGVDLLGPDAVLPAGIALGDDQAFSVVRIESGEPVMGAEIRDRTIAQEVGLVERAVSLTKGCYPGQELVARIDARGDNVPRRLRGVVLGGLDGLDGAPPFAHGGPSGVPDTRPGAVVTVDDRPVGELTSVAWSPRLSATVALAYIHRRVTPPGPARVETAAGAPVACEIVELPIFPG